jgi:hypothetical protein
MIVFIALLVLFVNLHPIHLKQGHGDGTFSGTSTKTTAETFSPANSAHEIAAGAHCHVRGKGQRGDRGKSCTRIWGGFT